VAEPGFLAPIPFHRHPVSFNPVWPTPREDTVITWVARVPWACTSRSRDRCRALCCQYTAAGGFSAVALHNVIYWCWYADVKEDSSATRYSIDQLAYSAEASAPLDDALLSS